MQSKQHNNIVKLLVCSIKNKRNQKTRGGGESGVRCCSGKKQSGDGEKNERTEETNRGELVLTGDGGTEPNHHSRCCKNTSNSIQNLKNV